MTPFLLSATNTGGLDNTSLILLGGVAILVVLLTITTRRRAADRGGSPREYLSEQLSHVREQKGIRQDMEELMLQLEKLSREISSQVDTRFAKLEQAIADADARIAEMKRLGFGRQGPSAGSLAAPPTRPEPRLSPDPTGPMSTPSEQPVGPATDATSSPEGQDAFNRQVLELTDTGLSPVEIGRRLNRNPGEIELIINLNRGRK
jgi:hypothetical protein